jgi:hypothetical protein
VDGLGQVGGTVGLGREPFGELAHSGIVRPQRLDRAADGLGKPDLSSGDKAKESVDELSSNIQQGVDKIDSAIKDAKSGSGLVTALSTVTSTISTMGSQVQTTFGELEQLGGELESAFKNASSCKSLTSQQG